MAIVMNKKPVAKQERITQRMRTELPYQSKSSRGLGRIEAAKGKVERVVKEERLPYRPGVRLCIERARMITESYKQTEGEPIILRRAKALAHYLDNRTLYILPSERIVGNIASKPNSLVTYPELWSGWLNKAIDKEYQMLLDDQERQELHQIHQYWRGKSVHGSERNLLPEEVYPYWFYNNQGVFLWLHGGHIGTPNYEKIFRVGLKGIVEEARAKLKELSSNPDSYLKADDYLNKRRFYEAVIISTEAAIRQGKRFAKVATEMAQHERDERRKAELEELAQICEWVPGNPPRSLHETLQSYWFVNLVARILDLQSSGNGERMDQTFAPFYEKDEREGKITREQAQELVEHLLLKFNEEGALVPPSQPAAGPLVTRVTTVGGQTRDGADATNEMTYIIMDAKDEMGLNQPAIAVRLHQNTPPEFYQQIVKSLLKQPGVYSFFNDEMMIPYLMNLGIPLEDARDYTTDGCVRWILPGKAMAQRGLGGMFAWPKCLELALYQGFDKFLGKQVGPKTLDPLTFTSIEDVIQAYLEQARFFLEKLFTINNIVDVLDGEWLQQPFLSGTLDGCLERGQDCREYKYFPNTIFQPVGQVTVANALAAMKKLVFEEKKVSMAELIDALKTNWEGKEELRQRFVNEAPKFGNDDDYVDLLAKDINSRHTKLVESFKNIWGGRFMEDGTGGSSYYDYSGLIGATPDGREDRGLLNDGTISPVIGTDKKGPTATLKSVGKIDHAGTFTHLFNQKFSPEQLRIDNGKSFISYMRTFVDLGIHHVQFNVIDRETLLNAQQRPENYSDLVVRVAGFAAYFVDLAEGVQDQIIARTEQGL
ncbi:MAG: pyruvate formate lyase family protein [Chloroflexota bacterium]|nr:pyruvate formate lyase family protein [Chloroflexota bacterium]